MTDPALATAYEQGRELQRLEMENTKARVSAEQDVRQVLQWLAGRTYRKRFRNQGVALWYVVSDLFAVGSTSAVEKCRQYGFDPDLKVKPLSD